MSSSSSPSSSTSNPWTTAPEHAGLVSIGTHSLYLSISGASRRRGDDGDKEIPNELMIIFTGAGDIPLSWTPVLRLLHSPTSSSDSSTVNPPRVLIYERSGLDQSARGPNRLTATVAATELLAALRSTGLITNHKSLILVAHSYGAIVAREFLHLLESPQAASSSSHTRGKGGGDSQIKALILVDPSTEKQNLSFPPPIPNPDFVTLLGSLNFARVTGLRANSKLTSEEWRARAKALSSPSHQGATQEEVSNYVEACETLGEKHQVDRQALGTRPLVVIRAESWTEYKAVYEAGVEAGNGSGEERRRFKELVDGWEEKDRVLKEEVLGLSSVEEVEYVTLEGERDGHGEGQRLEQGLGKEERSRKKMVYVKGCGHNVQLLRPDVIVREIYAVLETVRRHCAPDTKEEPRL